MYEHYDQILDAINAIGMIGNAKAKEEAVENKEEAAPEKKNEVKAEEPKAEPNAQEAKAEPEMRKGPSFSIEAEPEAQESNKDLKVRKASEISLNAEQKKAVEDMGKKLDEKCYKGKSRFKDMIKELFS